LRLQPDSFAIAFKPDGAVAGGTYLLGLQETIAVGSKGSVYVSSASIAQVQVIDDQQTVNGPCMSPVVQNGATFVSGAQRFAPGEIVTLRGTAFGPQSPAYGVVGGDERLMTKLAGVQVFFDEIPAPVLYAQATQINTMVPWEIAARPSTQIHVEYNGVATNSETISVVTSDSIGLLQRPRNPSSSRSE